MGNPDPSAKETARELLALVLDLGDVVEIARGTVRLRLHGSGAAAIKAPLLWTLPGEIEDAVVEAAPDAEKILIDGLDLLGVGAAVRAAD